MELELVFEKEYTSYHAMLICWMNWVPWDNTIMVSADKPRKLWDSLSELRSSVRERRLERTVLRPALWPVKTSQFTQVFRQVRRHTVKSLCLNEAHSVRNERPTWGLAECVTCLRPYGWCWLLSFREYVQFYFLEVGHTQFLAGDRLMKLKNINYFYKYCTVIWWLQHCKLK